MNESVRQFIETARRTVLSADLEQKELAAQLNVTPQHLNAVLNGRANLSRKLEQGLCRRLGLSPVSLCPPSVELAESVETGIGHGCAKAEPAYVSVPLRGGLLSHVALRKDWLACRSAGFAERESRVDRGTEREKGKVFLVRMEGNAMNPQITDGALVLVDGGQREPVHGRVYYVRLHDTLCFRRLHIEQGRVQAVCTISTDVTSTYLDKQEIIGRALWSCSDL